MHMTSEAPNYGNTLAVQASASVSPIHRPHHYREQIFEQSHSVSQVANSTETEFLAKPWCSFQDVLQAPLVYYRLFSQWVLASLASTLVSRLLWICPERGLHAKDRPAHRYSFSSLLLSGPQRPPVAVYPSFHVVAHVAR